MIKRAKLNIVSIFMQLLFAALAKKAASLAGENFIK